MTVLFRDDGPLHSYDVLNGYFPGRFRFEDRLHPDRAPPPNLNLEDSAEYLGISQRHLKDLCREKRINFTKPHSAQRAESPSAPVAI